MITKERLIEFETEIGDTFNQGKIAAPVHLYSGNEELMLEVFKDIDVENDWVCCTWRNHYQGLLKGIPEDVLKENIMKGGKGKKKIKKGGRRKKKMIKGKGEIYIYI
jgi:pyruvate dehydrogenase E1 component alpha subunit